eukprot:14126663-Ditylum_brightwellii.AAC.1
MKIPFNLESSIEDFFDQFNRGQDMIADAGQPYTDIQLIIKAYMLIYVSGVLNAIDTKCIR